MMNSRARLLALLSLLAATLLTELLYLPAAAGGFLGDDFWYLESARTLPWLQHPSASLLLWKILDPLFGFRPVFYHLLSLVLHLGCIALLGGLVFTISQDLRAALASAVLFAALPFPAEAVAWISASSTLLSAGFSLGALIAYHRWTRQGNWLWLGLLLALSALAMFCHESAFLLPWLLPIMDLALQGLTKPDRPRLIAWSSVAALGLILWSFHGIFLASPFDLPVKGFQFTEAASNLTRNLFVLCWPVLPQGKPVWASGLWTLSVAGVLGLGLVRAWRSPALLAAAAWFVLTLIPAAFQGRIGPENECSRILYFPALGLAALLGIALTRERSWPAVAAGVPVLLLALALALWSREPWVQAGKLSNRLARDFQALPLPLEPGDALLLSGVPLAFHGPAFLPNSYTLSLALSLARFPEGFRGRGPAEREQLPLYVISPMAPASEAEGLPLPRLRQLRRAPAHDFRYRLIWQYLRGAFTVVTP